MKKRIIFKILICLFLCSFYLCLTSCYVESGYDVSKKLNKTVTELDDKYILDHFSFIQNGGEPTIDLFQKRGSNEFKKFYFALHKKYQPKEIDINIEITNSVYKLKNDKTHLVFTNIDKSDIGVYYILENNEIKKHYASYEERKNGFIGGYSFFLDFPQPVKARQLEYIEFDLSITDEEGNVYNHHLHYDVSIKPVFKMGSTLWEYWMSI